MPRWTLLHYVKHNEIYRRACAGEAFAQAELRAFIRWRKATQRLKKKRLALKQNKSRMIGFTPC